MYWFSVFERKTERDRMFVRLLGTIDLLAAIIIFLTPLWKPIKIIIIIKLVYTGLTSWIGHIQHE